MFFAGRTDAGKERDINEDSFLIHTDSALKILAVADGMGGHAAGEVASKLAVDLLHQFISEQCCDLLESISPEEISKLTGKLMHHVNTQIVKKSFSKPDLYGMGTTLTVALIKDNILTVGHVGDSRAYLINQRKADQLTEDHSLVNELIKNGQIDKEEAEAHPQRHILTRALGTSEFLEPFLYQCNLNGDEHILLCTDGLYSLVKSEELQSVVLTRGRNLNDAADSLVELANQRGGHDNITIVLASGAGGVVAN